MNILTVDNNTYNLNDTWTNSGRFAILVTQTEGDYKTLGLFCVLW